MWCMESIFGKSFHAPPDTNILVTWNILSNIGAHALRLGENVADMIRVSMSKRGTAIATAFKTVSGFLPFLRNVTEREGAVLLYTW